jgi:hypothetical protein
MHWTAHISSLVSCLALSSAQRICYCCHWLCFSYGGAAYYSATCCYLFFLCLCLRFLPSEWVRARCRAVKRWSRAAGRVWSGLVPEGFDTLVPHQKPVSDVKLDEVGRYTCRRRVIICCVCLAITFSTITTPNPSVKAPSHSQPPSPPPHSPPLPSIYNHPKPPHSHLISAIWNSGQGVQ